MWYILNEKNKPIAATLSSYSQWSHEYPKKRIVKQENVGELYVSTVFLGMNRDYDEEKPILWETMIFSRNEYVENNNEYKTRYTSYEDALIGHETALEFARTIKTIVDNEKI